MDIFITLKTAFKTLYRNKMRSILTMLGIIIGVGSVIAMLGITSGFKRKILNLISSFGSNSLFIVAYRKPQSGSRGSYEAIKTMKPADAYALERECPSIAYASPLINLGAQLIRNNRNWQTSMRAANDRLQYIEAWEIEKGRFFGPGDVSAGAKVCVIGSIIEDNLYNAGENPIGTTIRINRFPFKVVGVLKSKGASGFSDMDDIVIIPYTTAMKRMYKKDYIYSITASADNKDDMVMAREEVTVLLRQRHKLSRKETDDFMIHSQDEIIKMVEDWIRNLTMLLASVASVSLLVGGIGIMNIMLVSVTERIREIGIRMAIGAKRRDILAQFLIESVAVSLIGGILGIGLGWLLSGSLASIFKIQPYITPFAIMLAMVFSSGVGIFFGFYPAWKASNLDPIKALRHE